MAYTDTLNRLSAATGDKVLALHERYLAGEITAAELEELVAAVIVAANGRAASLADLSLAATITLAIRRPVPVQGLTPPPTAAEKARLRRAARTILRAQGLPDTAENMRLARLGKLEPLTAASRATSDGIAKHDLVEGWTRGLHTDACQLCRWWHRDGRVWPKTHPMPTHKGCTCTQVPVLVEHVYGVETRRNR